MKILLVSNYTPDGQISLLGFAGALARGLEAADAEVRVIAPKPVLNAGAFVPARLRKWLGYIDKLVLFPPVLRRAAAWADIVHICEQGSAVYLKDLRNKPHLVTCHDLLGCRSAREEFPFWKTKGTGRVYQSLILRSLARAANVVCSSEATRRDYVRFVGTPEGLFPVAYLGLFHPYAPMTESSAVSLLECSGVDVREDSPLFLLHVGKNAPTKNRRGVLLIFDALRRLPGFENYRLVMAGSPFTADMRGLVSERGMDRDGSLLECVGLQNEQIHALYSRAEALLFPSLGEGFGMPIIEAQACGCPVFTSDRAPLTEIGGAGAGYIDPEQPEAAARVIAQRLSEPGERERMIAAGLKNVRSRFRTERMVGDYINLYEKVLAPDSSTAADRT